MEADVFVLLLGATPASYALASSFFGEFSVPVTVMDETVDPFFSASRNVAEVRCVPGIAYPPLLRRALSDFYETHAGKSLILLPMTERFSKAVCDDRAYLEQMYLLPQKNIQKAKETVAFPEALLLTYFNKKGIPLRVYARVVAYTDSGAPLALITEDDPQEKTVTLPKSDSGFCLYAIKDGVLLPYTEGEGISPLCVFPAASDASIAEWILHDYVLCDEPPRIKKGVCALFTLFPYKRIKSRILPAERERVRALHKKRLTVTLYSPENEQKGLFFRRAVRQYYRALWEKTAKTKK